MEKKPVKKGLLIGILAAVAVVIAVLVAGALLFTVIGGKLYRRTETALSLADAGVSGVSGILRLNDLREADLRGNPLSEDMVQELEAKFPDAVIRWDIPIGDSRYDSESTSLTLPDLAAAEAERLLWFPHLETVDATGSDCYDALLSVAAARPALTVRYAVDIGGTSVANTDTEAVLTEAVTDGDALTHALSYLPALTVLDVRKTALSNDDVLALTAAYPALDVRWSYRLSDGAAVDTGAEQVDLTGVTEADVATLDTLLSKLTPGTTVDLRGSAVDGETGMRLSDAYPELTLVYTVLLGGVSADTAATSLTPGAVTEEDLIAALSRFPALTDVDLRQSGLDTDACKAVADAYPGVSFRFLLDVCGKQVDTADTFLDLSNIDMNGSTAAVEAAMPYLRSMTQIDMCRCDIANEDMAALRDKFPACKFVWMVHLGRYLFRTDMTSFGTMNNPRAPGLKRTTSADMEVLKYCTDMISLDLGHNAISDLSFLKYVPNLELLILGDNRVSDISPIAGCKNIFYIELFMNDVADVSPLLELPNLTYLCVTSNEIQNPELFLQMPQLKRLWLKGSGASQELAEQLRQAFPDCNVNNSDYGTGGDWRQWGDPVYDEMRQRFVPYLSPDRVHVITVGY